MNINHVSTMPGREGLRNDFVNGVTSSLCLGSEAKLDGISGDAETRWTLQKCRASIHLAVIKLAYAHDVAIRIFGLYLRGIFPVSIGFWIACTVIFDLTIQASQAPNCKTRSTDNIFSISASAITEP